MRSFTFDNLWRSHMETETITAADVGELRVVAGVGHAVSTRHKAVTQLVEAAMAQAVLDALADGVRIEDADELIARKMAARQAVLDAVRG